MPPGTWRYTVTPLVGVNWRGAESPRSGIVTVGAATLTLATTQFGGPAAFPRTTTGTLTGFAANEGITYRLDAATPLTGSPSSAGPAGTAAITSLAIPAVADGPHTVWAIGNATVPSQASATILVDRTAPVVSASAAPAPNGAGWNSSAPVTVTLTANDGTGVGGGQIRYTTDGSDPTVSGTAQTYAAPLALNATTTLRFAASDALGNTSAIGSQTVRIDTTAPVNALTLSGVTGGAFRAGATVWYRGAAAGSFALVNAVTDAGSGPAASATAALAGTATGWSHVPGSVATPAGGPFTSAAFSWTAGTSSAPTETVTGTDVAGNAAATTLAFANDVTGPAGGSVDATGLAGTGGRYSTSTTLSVALSKGADAQSGLAPTGARLLRATATLTSAGTADGVCGAFGAFAQVGALDPASPVSDAVPDRACYRYQYVVPDNVGNATTYTSPDIKVDTTAPSTPTLTLSAATGDTAITGATVYINPQTGHSGGFQVAAVTTDLDSGIQEVSIPHAGRVHEWRRRRSRLAVPDDLRLGTGSRRLGAAGRDRDEQRGRRERRRVLHRGSRHHRPGGGSADRERRVRDRGRHDHHGEHHDDPDHHPHRLHRGHRTRGLRPAHEHARARPDDPGERCLRRDVDNPDDPRRRSRPERVLRHRERQLLPLHAHRHRPRREHRRDQHRRPGRHVGADLRRARARAFGHRPVRLRRAGRLRTTTAPRAPGRASP